MAEREWCSVRPQTEQWNLPQCWSPDISLKNWGEFVSLKRNEWQSTFFGFDMTNQVGMFPDDLTPACAARSSFGVCGNLAICSLNRSSVNNLRLSVLTSLCIFACVFCVECRSAGPCAVVALVPLPGACERVPLAPGESVVRFSHIFSHISPDWTLNSHSLHMLQQMFELLWLCLCNNNAVGPADLRVLVSSFYVLM